MKNLLRTSRLLPGPRRIGLDRDRDRANANGRQVHRARRVARLGPHARARAWVPSPNGTSRSSHAVAVRLSPAQLARLRESSDVRVYDDRAVSTRGTLLGGLTDLVNDVNSTLAADPLVQTVQTVAAPGRLDRRAATRS